MFRRCATREISYAIFAAGIRGESLSHSREHRCGPCTLRLFRMDNRRSCRRSRCLPRAWLRRRVAADRRTALPRAGFVAYSIVVAPLVETTVMVPLALALRALPGQSDWPRVFALAALAALAHGFGGSAWQVVAAFWPFVVYSAALFAWRAAVAQRCVSRDGARPHALQRDVLRHRARRVSRREGMNRGRPRQGADDPTRPTDVNCRAFPRPSWGWVRRRPYPSANVRRGA